MFFKVVFILTIYMARTITQQKEEFDRLLVSMDIHRQVRELEKEPDYNPNHEEALILEHLLVKDKEQGGSMTMPQAQAQYDVYKKQNYDLEAPKSGFNTWLANAHLKRDRISRFATIMAVAAMVGMGTTYGGKLLRKAAVQKAEAKVEQRVEGVYWLRLEIEKSLDAFADDQTHPRYGSTIERLIMPSYDIIENLDNTFFSIYMENGSAKETVTPENYKSVKVKLNHVEDELTQDGNKRLVAKKLISLSEEESRLYGDIGKVAKEDIVLRSNDSNHNKADALIDNANVADLSQLVNNMRNTYMVVSAEYEYLIHPGNEVYSGFYRNAPGGGRNFYVTIEAHENGKRIPQWIKNEENNRTEQVKYWGERVPERIYERVKNDKTNNGIIDNDEFGYKEKGYVTPEFTYPGVNERKGQVTRW